MSIGAAPARLPLARRVAYALLPAVLLIAAAEAGSRVYFVWKRGGGLQRLVMPFGPARRVQQAEYRYRPTGSYTQFDLCTQRELTMSINRWGGRGADLPAQRSPGAVRIVAAGGSTTFGASNPDDMTWPALLEAELRRRGTRAEILNLGAPSKRLEQINGELPKVLGELRPDLVIYYEGSNNATAHASAFFHADTSIARFHRANALGRLASFLHYRSVFYTLLLEKLEFSTYTQGDHVVPELDYFTAELRQFIGLVRAHGARPVFVLQCTKAPPAPSLRALELKDKQAVRAAILQAVAGDALDSAQDRVNERLWMYQAQVMVEAVRRTGESEGLQVIDPRPALAGVPDASALFCDMFHVRDEGNAVLASAIADELDLAPAR